MKFTALFLGRKSFITFFARFFVSAGFAIFSVFLGGKAMASTSHLVVMKSISFEPKKVQIHVGDTVEWTNKSYTEHSATFDEDGAGKEASDTGTVAPKKNSKKIQFPSVGTFHYHCSIHGKTMSGEVVVVPMPGP